jgi:epoxyqueuosine reductase
VEPYVLDARRCISYLTIELRGSVPEALREPIGRHIFGCDICQDVCPWNRRAPVTPAEAFQPRTFTLSKRPVESDEVESESVPSDGIAVSTTQSLLLPSLEWVVAMTEDDYKVAFRNCAIKRAKWRGMVRNACIALGNAKLVRGTRAGDRVSALLQRLAASPDPPISESALWALCRIQ